MAAHILYYKNFKIVYENGLYRIDGYPLLPFITINDAKAKIDEMTKDEPTN